jgi:hypothetical protein
LVTEDPLAATWRAPHQGGRRPSTTFLLERTHIPEAPRRIVHLVGDKKARLDCINHLPILIPYTEIEQKSIVLPERLRNANFIQPVPTDIYVPERYSASQLWNCD